jgi:hypothetical protein
LQLIADHLRSPDCVTTVSNTLYRVVRPMNRDGSRFEHYVRRNPADVRDRLVGRTLHFPLGEGTHAVTISPRAQAIRFSLRADEPAEVKA